MKPILFNTEMVRAIMSGRKTVTRRVVRGINNTADFLELTENPSIIAVDKHGQEYPKEVEGLYADFVQDGNPEYPLVKAPYCPGDILYVRETWGDGVTYYLYRADYPDGSAYIPKWRPSIHMPKEAARLFLRVKAVRVERVQNITDEQALKEGVPEDSDYPLESPVYCPKCKGEGLIGTLHPVSLGYMEVDCPNCDTPAKRFANLWNSTIKPADLGTYGWAANPWVWVIEFERITKEEAENG